MTGGWSQQNPAKDSMQQRTGSTGRCAVAEASIQEVCSSHAPAAMPASTFWLRASRGATTCVARASSLRQMCALPNQAQGVYYSDGLQQARASQSGSSLHGSAVPGLAQRQSMPCRSPLHSTQKVLCRPHSSQHDTLCACVSTEHWPMPEACCANKMGRCCVAAGQRHGSRSKQKSAQVRGAAIGVCEAQRLQRGAPAHALLRVHAGQGHKQTLCPSRPQRRRQRQAARLLRARLTRLLFCRCAALCPGRRRALGCPLGSVCLLLGLFLRMHHRPFTQQSASCSAGCFKASPGGVDQEIGGAGKTLLTLRGLRRSCSGSSASCGARPATGALPGCSAAAAAAGRLPRPSADAAALLSSLRFF